MMVSVYTMLASCVFSALIGGLLPIIWRRYCRRFQHDSTEIIDLRDRDEVLSGAEVEKLVRSLYQLTSQVDSQVGQHTQKVSEITNSLTGPEDVGSTLVLVAGKMLITANQKLQADLEEAKQEIQRQREQMDSCIHESRTDPLTNIANRRGLDLELSRAFAQRRRDGNTFSLLIIDIDHFKKFNDQYGHMLGDQLLKCFSRCLTNTFRESDFVARFGGEEFVAILKRTSLEDACKAAERVRIVIESNHYKIGETDIRLTASIGIKEVVDDETEAETLQKADEALYAAKNGGRNRCYFYDGELCHEYIPTEESEPTENSPPTMPLNDPVPDTVLFIQENVSRPSEMAYSAGNA